MSEQDHERPLTRRELRLREQAASGEAAEAADAGPGEAAVAASETSGEAPANVEIEIDPLNPDGTPRTRREMRELREAALAQLAADTAASDDVDAAAAVNAVQAEAPAPVVPMEEPVFDEYGAPTEALSLEDLPQHDSSETELDAPTEAFTLEDILEAAEPTAPTGDADAVAALFATDQVEIVADSLGETAVPADADIDAAEAGAVEAETHSADIEHDADLAAADLEASAVIDGAATADEADEADEAELQAGAEAEASTLADVVAEELDAQAEAEGEADTGTDTAGYSFPDIQPPEEWRSVFDDPSRAASISAPGESGDFDDLISRAVAQEGSTGGTGASALILPSHPGDTGGLTGPLGATGELFVTGSIELPKSMGETGGHSGIHDSIDFDPFLTDGVPEPIGAASDSGPTPVSALSAVSARRRPEVPVVAEPTKDRSKLPLILALSGGGLIVVVAGVVVYAASQGLFN
ncbi:hypothetical protein ACFSWE_00310 [Leucobacter albus]|uniref:Uncharacterized protein n=1 Tax=Leucobacter albus TaxID=272210 RepID=A0ABW3TQP9_9MICO